MSIDLSTIHPEIIMARGEYSTVRAAHEDAKKELSILCGHLQSTAAQILRHMQPGEDEVPASVADLLAYGRATMDKIGACAENVESLAKQRADLKALAWGK